jgi:2-hydroxychromene-2-carboxylate isomerase
VSTILPLRSCVVACAQGKDEQAMLALFRAYWVEDDDISDPEVVERALTRAGLDGKALVAATQEADVKNALRRNTDLALSRGVFGVPTFFVGERSFWGNDRLRFVEAELRREQ